MISKTGAVTGGAGFLESHAFDKLIISYFTSPSRPINYTTNSYIKGRFAKITLSLGVRKKYIFKCKNFRSSQ